MKLEIDHMTYVRAVVALEVAQKHIETDDAMRAQFATAEANMRNAFHAAHLQEQEAQV